MINNKTETNSIRAIDDNGNLYTVYEDVEFLRYDEASPWEEGVRTAYLISGDRLNTHDGGITFVTLEGVQLRRVQT